MIDLGGEENYYELLKVDPRATVAEIVTAYHTAKNAFSKDSVATYSLFSSEEAERMLARLEEAYLTLSNLERRADYDRKLTRPLTTVSAGDRSPLHSLAAPPVESSLQEFAPSVQNFPPPSGVEKVADVGIPFATPSDRNAAVEDNGGVAAVVAPNEDFSGVYFKEIRMKRGLSAEDVSRITKIPTKFVKSIESDDFKRLPARVYIQGFIKNMAVLYKIDPKATAQGYLAYLDKVFPSAP